MISVKDKIEDKIMNYSILYSMEFHSTLKENV